MLIPHVNSSFSVNKREDKSNYNCGHFFWEKSNIRPLGRMHQCLYFFNKYGTSAAFAWLELAVSATWAMQAELTGLAKKLLAHNVAHTI